MNRVIYISLAFVALLGCAPKPTVTVTPEQAVYESLFLKIIGDARTEYFLVESTESHWFKTNPYVSEEWEKHFSAEDGLSAEIIKSLYASNVESTSLSWSPFLTNAKLLPSRYNKPARSVKQQELCLVEEGKGNISIRTKDGKGYRSYYTVSKVAFSEGGELALVKYSRHCAPLSGAGEFLVVLQFIENGWSVVSGKVLWIS